MSVNQYCVMLLVAGLFFWTMAFHGLSTGVIRAGNWGFTPYRPSRATSPLAFWFFFTLYFCGGLASLGYSAAVFWDVAQPPHNVRRAP